LVLTDLHLSSKDVRVRRALRAAEGDAILVLGDSVHDGLPAQFDAFRAAIEATVPDKVVLETPSRTSSCATHRFSPTTR